MKRLLKHSNFFSLLAKAGLVAIAFFLVLRGIDKEEFLRMLREQRHSALIEAGALLILQMLFGAVRWQYITLFLAKSKEPVLSLFNAVRYFYISVFFNCCLPGTVGGDVVRVWLIKSEHVPLHTSISSVVIDRLIALVALGVMVFFTLPVMLGYSAVSEYVSLSSFIVMPAFAALGVVGVFLLLNLNRLPVLAKLGWLEHFLHNFRLLITAKKAIFFSVLLAALGHACFCVAAYILAGSLGSPISLTDSLTLVPWVLLISIIPVSIGGWGLREAAMVFTFHLILTPQEVALAVSVQLGLLSIITSLPAGLLWLTNRGKHKIG